MGQPYKNILTSCTEEPIASASIGQVHKATLQSGDVVALKVQRPTISKVIKADLRALSIVMFLAGRFTIIGKTMNTKQLFSEVERVISAELDFKQELQNGLLFQEKYADSEGVHIPSFNESLTTKKVLVMEWIEGTSVIDKTQIELLPYSKDQLAKNLLALFLEQLLREGIFLADPHPGNILLKQDGTIVLIDLGWLRQLKSKIARNYNYSLKALY
ncbi:AarF/ABC1/UbiB kinase family protein [Bacillus sp. LL01]|uniref:AarF/ABC1/UbiB kinase family protein n=1 Tax=Bacillus sp. LL01 TaxID=1665556 RepID=UPI00069E7B5A|nr:AarF/ABC1/UbiB kinase family protein [Bacillus sp. LL01]